MQPSCILVGLGNTLSSRWAGDSPVSQPRLRGVRYTSPGVSFSFIIETVLRWEVLLYLCTKILLYLFCLLLRTYFDRPHWEFCRSCVSLDAHTLPPNGLANDQRCHVTFLHCYCSPQCVWQSPVMATWLTTSVKSFSKPATSSSSWHGSINLNLTNRVSFRLSRIILYHLWEPRCSTVRRRYRRFRILPPSIPMSTALSYWPARRAQSANVLFPPSLQQISRLIRTNLASTTPHASPFVKCYGTKWMLNGPWYVSAG